MLADSKAKINEYLDLKRVIETQEFLQTALSVLLSQRQARIVKQISLSNMTLFSRQTFDRSQSRVRPSDSI